MTEDEMVGWHKFEQALGDNEGQGSLACFPGSMGPGSMG